MYPFVHVNFLSSFVVPPSTAQAELFIHPSVHTSTHPSSLYLWIYLSIYLHTPSSCFHEFIHTLMHFHTHTHLLSFLTSLPPPLPCFSQSSLNTIHPHIKHSSLLTMSIHKCVHPLILWSFFSSSFLPALTFFPFLVVSNKPLQSDHSFFYLIPPSFYLFHSLCTPTCSWFRACQHFLRDSSYVHNYTHASFSFWSYFAHPL